MNFIERVNNFVKDDDMEDNFDDPNMLIGEDLLNKHFSLSGQAAVRVLKNFSMR